MRWGKTYTLFKVNNYSIHSNTSIYYNVTFHRSFLLPYNNRKMMYPSYSQCFTFRWNKKIISILFPKTKEQVHTYFLFCFCLIHQYTVYQSVRCTKEIEEFLFIYATTTCVYPQFSYFYWFSTNRISVLHFYFTYFYIVSTSLKPISRKNTLTTYKK